MGKDQLASVIVEVNNRGKSYGEGPTCKQGVLMLMEKPVRM